MLFWAIVILSIVLHEYGHYIVARFLGFKIEEFSIGLGPSPLGFHTKSNYWALRPFLIGGYVRFDEDDYLRHHPLKRLLVAAAGPIASILPLFVVISIRLASLALCR